MGPELCVLPQPVLPVQASLPAMLQLWRCCLPFHTCAGSVLALPTPITYLPFNDSGTLLPAAASEPAFDLGSTTAGQFAQRLQAGSAVYYMWRPASRRTVSLGACSPTLELEMVVFVDGILQW